MDGITRKPDKIRAFLIGQLAKNNEGHNGINLEAILSEVYIVLREAQIKIGGRVILLECKDEPKLISSYERQGFKPLDTDDDNELLRMYKIFD